MWPLLYEFINEFNWDTLNISLQENQWITLKKSFKTISNFYRLTDIELNQPLTTKILFDMYQSTNQKPILNHAILFGILRVIISLNEKTAPII